MHFFTGERLSGDNRHIYHTCHFLFSPHSFFAGKWSQRRRILTMDAANSMLRKSSLWSSLTSRNTRKSPEKTNKRKWKKNSTISSLRKLAEIVFELLVVNYLPHYGPLSLLLVSDSVLIGIINQISPFLRFKLTCSLITNPWYSAINIL